MENDFINRLNVVLQKIEKKLGIEVEISQNQEHPAVVAFDDYYKNDVLPWFEINKQIGVELLKVNDLLIVSFEELRKIIVLATKCKNPGMDKLQVIYKTLMTQLDKIEKFRFDNIKSKFYDHLYSISEGIKCLSWILTDIPVSFVKEMIGAAQFYSNKVLVKYRKLEEGKIHVQWIEKWHALIEKLSLYVKEFHTAGLQWNLKGENYDDFSKKGGEKKEEAKKIPEKKIEVVSEEDVPPPPIDLVIPVEEIKPAKIGGINEVFDQLKKGELPKLQHVTKEMKTKYRPPEERVSIVKDVPKKESKETIETMKKIKKGVPKLELVEEKKWVCEFQEKNYEIKITDVKMSQAIYIFGCNDVGITIIGKFNSIVIDSCVKTTVIMDNALSSAEIVNSKNINLQVNDYAPTITLDKCDSIHLWLQTEKALTAQIVSSKCSEMNVNVIEGDDSIEYPIPEQFISTWDKNKKKIITVPTSHI